MSSLMKMNYSKILIFFVKLTEKKKNSANKLVKIEIITTTVRTYLDNRVITCFCTLRSQNLKITNFNQACERRSKKEAEFFC